MATTDTSKRSARRGVKSPKSTAAPIKRRTPDSDLKIKPATRAVEAAAATPESARPAKPKQKLVRDSFTMPTLDFALIGQLKDRMVAFRRPAKKSELLRAGLHTLMALPDAKLAAALDQLAPLKPGRPKKTP